MGYMKKYSSILILFFSIFLFSCGGITETGVGSVSFNAGQLSRTIARNAVEQENNIILELATIGDYVTSTKETFSQIDDNYTVTLNRIPVGSQIRVKVSLSYGPSDNQKVVEGISDEFIVVRGENKVSIKLKGQSSDDESDEEDEIITDIFIYNRIEPPQGDPNVTEANYALYRFSEDVYTSDTVQTPKASYSQGSKFTDFVVGDDDKLYFTDGLKLYCGYNAVTELMNINLETNYNPDEGETVPVQLYYDTNDIVFYGSATGWEGVWALGAYDVKLGVYTNQVQFPIQSMTDTMGSYGIDYAISLTYGDKTESADEIEETYNGMLYLYSDTIPGRKLFLNVPIVYTRHVTSDESIKEVSITFDENISDYIEIRNIDTYLENHELSDLTIQDGYLYALFYSQSIQTSAGFNSDLTVRSYGALVKFDLDDFVGGYGVIVESEILADNDQNSDIINLLHLGSSSHYGKFFQPQNDFFCPQKFVAVKPKKLVIAEDGVFFYKEGDDYKYRNINRIFEYDIDHDSYESYTLNTDTLIKFDNQIEEDLVFQYNTGTATANWHTAATFTEE